MTDKPEIKPKYVDGEPVCSGECDQSYYHNDVFCCKLGNYRDLSVCIPALRRDRDKYKYELERLENDRTKLVVILCHAPSLPCGTDEFSREDIPELVADMLGVEHWEEEAAREIKQPGSLDADGGEDE